MYYRSIVQKVIHFQGSKKGARHILVLKLSLIKTWSNKKTKTQQKLPTPSTAICSMGQGPTITASQERSSKDYMGLITLETLSPIWLGYGPLLTCSPTNRVPKTPSN
jgi:hypothetical protein